MAKKKSTAQKQRAKARQQQQRATSENPQASTAPQAQAGTPRPRRQPQRRPASRSRRSSRWTSWTAIGAVVLVIVGMVVLFATKKSPTGGNDGGSKAAIAKVTSVPASTLEKVGVPSNVPLVPKLPVGTPPIESGGKPVVTYIGAEYCPYCAGERWPMVVALSRFGTFSDLGTTSSASSDIFPNTATPSFHGSSYTSDYLVFSSVETETNQPSATGGWTPLDTPTAQQQQLIATYDLKQYTGSSDGGIPFIMIGNLYTWAGATLDPGILKGMSFDQIANQLADPSSKVAQQIGGSANLITAAICQLTGNQPGEVCSAPYIQQEQAKLQGQ